MSASLASTRDVAVALSVGDALPVFAAEPITRLQLALFASAAADHNPIHVDDDAARAGGLPRAIAHGMLTMAFLGRALTRWVPQSSIRSLDGRFVAMAFPGDVVSSSATVTSIAIVDGERRAELALVAANARGETLLTGKASVVV